MGLYSEGLFFRLKIKLRDARAYIYGGLHTRDWDLIFGVLSYSKLAS